MIIHQCASIYYIRVYVLRVGSLRSIYKTCTANDEKVVMVPFGLWEKNHERALESLMKEAKSVAALAR